MKTRSSTSYLSRLAEPVAPGEVVLTVRRRALAQPGDVSAAPAWSAQTPAARVVSKDDLIVPGTDRAAIPPPLAAGMIREQQSVDGSRPIEPEHEGRDTELFVTPAVTFLEKGMPQTPAPADPIGPAPLPSEHPEKASALAKELNSTHAEAQSADLRYLVEAGHTDEPKFPHTSGAVAEAHAQPRVESRAERSSIHIGTVEVCVRTAPPPRPVPAPPPTAAFTPMPPAGPIARPLAWRYGLVQG